MGWGGVCQEFPANRIEDHLHHALDIPRHLRIPEPQNLKPLRRQPLIPCNVPIPTMPTAVNLDHQPPSQIGKIHNERPDGRLSPEVHPQHPVQLAQLRPDAPFLRRHLMAQLPGIGAGDGVNACHPSHPMPKAPHPNPPHKGGGSAKPPTTSAHPNRPSVTPSPLDTAASPPPSAQNRAPSPEWPPRPTCRHSGTRCRRSG
jgi:hypothetical protein